MKPGQLSYLQERAACGTGFITHLSARPSHALVRDALSTVARLAHRGAVSADGRTGDGSGILTQIPRKLFSRDLARRGITMPEDFAVGMFFIGRDDARARSIIEESLAARDVRLLAWRDAPIDLDALGEHARRTRPDIAQAIIARPAHLDENAFERALWLARQVIERRAREEEACVYVASLSSRTIVYKGLFVAPQLPRFYRDLADPDFESALALFHQRYSTNTFPTWERAQPFRMLCHNGEINTLQGNIAWMRAREAFFPAELSPVIDLTGSDSAMLDNALELLTRAGRDIAHAAMMVMPEAWEKIADISAELKSFYRYHATMMEPWDGPAAVAFSDGRFVGMTLDRNGLRPARYLVTDDGLIVASSEAGALEIDPARVIEKGKLGPGQMIVADLARGELWRNDRVKNFYASRAPYGEWLDAEMRVLNSNFQLPTSNFQSPRSASNVQLQAAFGYTDEELTVVLKPMATDSAEPIGSMGDDTPHAVQSQFERPLYHFFKQRFAQVTNPPIDPLREELVMSLRVLLGARGNILDESPAHAHLIELASPMLTDSQLDALRAQRDEFPHAHLDATFSIDDLDALERAVECLGTDAERAIDRGNAILILSDRAISATRAPVPMLLAVSAVHQHLLRAGKRWRASIIAEVGDARDVHQFAALIGFGADALNPYLALASARELIASRAERGNQPPPQPSTARGGGGVDENFVHAAEKGILKIMSKMGIATIDAYHGAQIFEIIGIDDVVVDRYFTGTPSHIGGIGLREIAQDVLANHARAFGLEIGSWKLEVGERASNQAIQHLTSNFQPPITREPRLRNYGFFKFKKEGEHHAYNPRVVQLLHAAVRTPGALNGNFRAAYATYREFVAATRENSEGEISDYLDIARGDPISLDQVEPTREILKRFSAAAMSHGSLSIEAHRTITEALNRLGAASNSGEGGEHPSRYGTLANSRIKQVASGRFGVTPAYLMSADELQIKMAQGSKPGEGGQLPGHKVTAEIAAIRHSQPGNTLISPPPHHDIYSIEDLAQLIYDLKRINPRARVSVKLVAGAGVGTIAAGVAKAFADVIQISGHSGGTGASPLSSIKHVGAPWELGLAETQQVLVANDLRARVKIRVDGGLKTARHVIIAALLGADEFSFGTAALVASGCVMARACHLNTCPVGIATQKEELRKKFPNNPEWAMAYFQFVAEETREFLASLGARSLDEIVGRVELLHAARAEAMGIRDWRLDQSPISNLSENKNGISCQRFTN